ncbi:hypothetical protein PPSQR21_010420 [Paenibacillus polymyxa SQR-21]|nr:hypothetical protein PPSQR21_010420 [Paenibacillus polymyxa SQR-21]
MMKVAIMLYDGITALDAILAWLLFTKLPNSTNMVYI